jgi:hypothetical protein
MWANRPHQLGGIEAIALGPPPTAVGRDAGRGHDLVRHALGGQPAVQPEAVAARLVAGVHRRVGGKADAPLGRGQLLQHRLGVATADGPQAGCISRCRGKGQLPLGPAQLQSPVEGGRAVLTMLLGRCQGQAPFQENERKVLDGA